MSATEEEQLEFITNEGIFDELQRIKDELVHVGYTLPRLARRCNDLMRQVAPERAARLLGDESDVADPGEVGEPTQAALSEPGAL